jgi:hypothetical protein
MGPLLKDTDWVRQSFLLGVDKQGRPAMDDADLAQRTFSSASLKFVDTTPGGNFCINPPPQFCRAADPKVAGRFGGSSGLGRYYSEAIDDNNQVIYMRFGVPAFNSLTTFFTGFYNTGAGQLARTGRAKSAFFLLGQATGFVVSVMSWRLLAVHLLGVAYKFLAGKPTSKFYYLKPTMSLYWNAVQTMVNQIAVNRGIVPRLGGPSQGNLNDGYEFDEAARQKLHQLLPDIFNEGGSIDVYAMANRAQRLARAHHKKMQAALDGDANADVDAQIRAVLRENLTDENRPKYQEYLQKWFDTAQSEPKEEAGKSEGASSNTEQLNNDDQSANRGFLDFLTAELDDGGAFASFRVNSTGQVSESFSNTVADSELANKINNMSASSRSTNFDFAGGNLDDGVIGSIVGGVMNAAKDFASGIGSALSISGLAALGGAAFVDIPKHWQTSMANLPRGNYTIHLSSPYGNPVSQLVNIYIPLCMLLAGALPISTGKQSYTSPFLLELYDQGRCQTRLGMIDSMTIQRGTSNLGFNRDGHAMGIDISFSIVDMSSVMHMPISAGFSLNPVEGVFDEDTVYSDYLAVVSGMGLADQIYSLRKLKLNLTRKMTNFDTWASKSHFASFLGDTWPGRLASIPFRGVDR